MNRTVSTYLDLVRFLAATMVFITHASYDRFTSGWLNGLSGFGNDAVMVFFVLSGYVIAYVTDKKENNYKVYFLARFARLWSVVVPALVLTVTLDYIGSRIDYSVYAGWWFRPDDPFWRILANLFFVNELWFASIRPFSNGPFWSIGYEFWYYVAFAALIFGRSKWRWVLFVLCAVVMGPKILLLMPIWLIGVLTYEKSKNLQSSSVLGWLLILGSIAGYVAYRHFEINKYLLSETALVLGPDIVKDLVWSGDFIGNHVVGILVAAQFIGIIMVSRQLDSVLRILEKPIRFLASYTFSIYLLHYPLLHFFAAITENDPSNPFHQAFILIGTITCIFLVGTFTERKKASVRKFLEQSIGMAAAYFTTATRRKRTS